MVLELITASTLTSLVSRKYYSVEKWKALLWLTWLTFLIYTTSLLYPWSSLIIQFAIGVEAMDGRSCYAAALTCPIIYCVAKVSWSQFTLRFGQLLTITRLFVPVESSSSTMLDTAKYGSILCMYYLWIVR
jgi:hypothetical protein